MYSGSDVFLRDLTEVLLPFDSMSDDDAYFDVCSTSGSSNIVVAVVAVVVVVADSVVVWFSLVSLIDEEVDVDSVSALLTLHPVRRIESRSRMDRILDVVFILNSSLILL